MIIPPSFKPEKCVAHPKMGRKKLEHLILDGQNLVATDGRVMVVVPIEREDGDRDGYVSAEAVIQARKNRSNIKCGESFVLSNGMSLPRNSEIEAIKPYEWEKAAPTTSMSYKLGLDVSKLTKICEAMGEDCVSLEVHFTESGVSVIKVVPIGKNKSYGVMMGIKVE